MIDKPWWKKQLIDLMKVLGYINVPSFFLIAYEVLGFNPRGTFPMQRDWASVLFIVLVWNGLWFGLMAIAGLFSAAMSNPDEDSRPQKIGKGVGVLYVSGVVLSFFFVHAPEFIASEGWFGFLPFGWFEALWTSFLWPLWLGFWLMG